MWFPTLSALWRSRSGRRTARRRPAFTRLTVEALEDRIVPSTFTVHNLNDSGPDSLRAAISAANANPDADVIKFAGGLSGTIALASELSITQDLTIDGPGAGTITVSGNNATRVFHVSGGTTDVTIDGLTIANGLASVPAGAAFGGGLLNDGASVSLAQVVCTNNRAVGSYAGGGAVANLGGHFSADHTDFLGNSVSGASTNFGNGGAVYDELNAIVDITQSTFSGNQATAGNANGGAIGHYGGSQLTLAFCSFAGNQVLALPPGAPLALDAAGGAIESDTSLAGFFGDHGQPTLTITHCSFTGNLAHVAASAAGVDGGQANGGALDFEDRAVATVSLSTFDGNESRGGDGGDGSAGNDGGAGGQSAGGAIYDAASNLTVSSSQFRGNASYAGNGGKGGSGGSGGSGALSFGGALFNGSGTLTVLASTFTDNEARGGAGGDGGPGGPGGGGGFGLGGAINATAFATPPVTDVADSLLAGNRAVGGNGGAGGSGGDGGPGGFGSGGAILNIIGTLTVSHSVLVSNQAIGGAGGAAGAGGTGGDGALAAGGGVFNGIFDFGGSATISDTSVVNNQAIGGAGGAGGGNGGDGLGGGLFNSGGATMTVDHSNVDANRAGGGAAGSGGSAGTGIGGGIFNDALIILDALTHVHGNKADVFEDCFGCP